MEGYTFNGWVEVHDNYGRNYPAEMPVPKTANGLGFQAQWIINEYSITFDAGDGLFTDPISMETSSTYVIKDEYNTNIAAKLPVAPELEGYTLIGWAGDNGVNYSVTGVPTAILPYDLILSAVWQINQVTVTYDPNGGIAIHPETYTEVKVDFDLTYNYGDELILPDISRDGYEFAGWIESTYGWNYPNTIPDVSTMKFTAKWKGVDYTWAFDANGGTVDTHALSNDPTLGHTDIVPGYTIVVNANNVGAIDPMLPIHIPVKAGYTFESWIDETGKHWSKAEIDALGTAPFLAADKTFTANWLVNPYKVTFDGKGGELINPNTGLPAAGYYTQLVEFGTKIPFPADPVAKGFTFQGWAETGIGYGYNHPETMPAEELYFDAQWTVNDYTITLDANGGAFIDPIIETESAIVEITEKYGTALTGKWPTVALTARPTMIWLMKLPRCRMRT